MSAHPNPVSFSLSTRMSRMTTSAVREILKVAERPDILSFAGGLPAPELFPIDAVSRAHSEVFAREGQAALQYSTTEGFLPLREWISARMGQRGLTVPPDQLLITNGSQQGIDLVGKVLLDRGDTVVVENPSYLAALQAFSGFEAKLAVVGSDDLGMKVDELEEVILREKPKLIYVIPEFNNPKGTSLAQERRLQLVRLAQKHRVPVLEDDPYGEIRFRGETPKPLAALDDQGVVIYLSTFSKTLAPGMRIGWIAMPKSLVRGLTISKQATDLHSSTVSQRAIAHLLETFDLDGHLAKIRDVYRVRGEAMLRALETELPKGTRWTRPEGGLFIWVRLPDGLDTQKLLPRALDQKVAFVPGHAFFAANPEPEYMRLNFSNRPEPLIAEGMARLGRVVKDALA
jgi:2-aminoadipate transaminase